MSFATYEAFSFLNRIWVVAGVRFHPLRKFQMLYNVYAILVFTTANIIFPTAFIINMLTIREIATFLKAFQVGINLVASCLKVGSILLMRSDFHEIRRITQLLDAKAAMGGQQFEISHLVRFCKKLVLSYFVWYNLYIWMAFVASILDGHPPYSIYMPFIDWTRSHKEFYLVNAIQFLVMTICCNENVTNDTYPLICVCIFRTHMRILTQRVQRCGSGVHTDDEEKLLELKGCIQDHNTVLKLFECIRKMISRTIFIQFLVTTIVLGTTVVSILLFDGTWSNIVASMMYAISVALETLPCCYLMNIVMEESALLPKAIFHLQWFDQSMKFKKMLIPFMQRAQQDNIILAGNIVPITLDSFIAIIKLTFSLVTILRKMGSKGV